MIWWYNGEFNFEGVNELMIGIKYEVYHEIKQISDFILIS